MTRRLSRRLSLSVTALAATAAAQAPELRLQATAPYTFPLQSLLLGNPGQPFVTLLDVNGGPLSVLGQTLWLGATPALGILDAGLLDAVGARSLSIRTAGLLPDGVPVFLQSVVVDQGLPVLSNGQSAIVHRSPFVIVQEFRDAAAEGFAGTFDRQVRGRLQGGTIRRRTANTADAGGARFGAPVAGPLNPFGVRMQMVFRTSDLGATGEAELITGMRWLPFNPVVQDMFQRVGIQLSHTHVVPDYRVDPFSALPMFPNSGLNPIFAQNYRPSEQPLLMFDGPYLIRPVDVRPDGYLPYPLGTQFPYDGTNSLLVEFKTPPSPGTSGVNGAAVHIMVMSSPDPNARAYDSGTSARPVDPYATTQGRGENTLHLMQFEFARVKTVATSPFLAAPAGSQRDFQRPFLAASLPPGTRIDLEFQGSNDPAGANTTAWSPVVDIADGRPYLRYRVNLHADLMTGAVPSLDTLVIPIQ
jgi:hypothetical protein